MSCEQRGHGMSGRKTVTVDEAAWRQAQAAASRLREVNRNLPAMLDAVRRDQQEQLSRVTAAVQARQDSVDRSLTALSKQTRKLEAQTSRRLREQAAALRGELRDVTAKLAEDTRRSLDEQEERWRSELEQERDQRTRDFQELQAGLAGIRQAGERVLADSKDLVGDAQLLAATIAENLPHERFAPGRLAALQQRLAVARGNLDRGAGEAALSQAQELCLQLGELRAEVEMRDQEWRLTQIAAVSAATVLQEQIRLSSFLDVKDEQGEQIHGVSLDVDYWSDGELAKLREAADTLARRAADRESPASLEELRAIIERDAPGLDERLTEIVGQAGARQFASQVRVNLAEFVVETLEDTTGFVWEDGQATYAGDDPRQAFYSKLRHLDDSEIVVEVAPDENGESCVLRIMSYDSGTPDEEERARRFHVITDRLAARGLQVGKPAAEQGEPDPALADLDSIRRQVPEVRPARRPAVRQQHRGEGRTA